MNHRKILYLTQTAIYLALLLVIQALSASLGQYITGSAVNFILIISLLIGGVVCGMTVAILSPIFAFLLGIGVALLPLLPFIILGNISIVLVWFFIGVKIKNIKENILYLIALITGGLVKTFILYFGIVKILVPVLNLPEKQATVLSISFSYPQLITAIIGGTLAIIIAPRLIQFSKKKQNKSHGI